MDWNNIPQDILDLILQNVFGKDRHTFRLVCRSWNESASPYRRLPCLMLYQTSNNKHLWKFFQHNSFSYVDLSKLEGAKIRFSNHGWLLMSCDDDETLFFYDPFNHHMINLPAPFDFDCDAYTTMCFFHPPTSRDCFILGIATIIDQGYYEVEIGVLKHGEDEWKAYIYDSSPHGFQVSLGPPVLDGGLLYFLDSKGNVATFDISEHGNDLAWSVFTGCLKPRRLRKNIKEHFLIKPKGEKDIFAVFAMYSDRVVRVYRLSRGPSFSWESVEDLGDRVFYVSNTSAFGYTTHVKNLANKIFFPKFYGDNVVYYSLDTRQYHCFKGDYSSKNSHGIRRLDFATWTMPSSSDDTQLPKESLEWFPEEDETTTAI